jgi:hypothetical protein
MARMQKNARLQSREARSKLPVAKEPYWHSVERGRHLGYYKGSEGGSWWLRERVQRRYVSRRLGRADDTVDAGADVLCWSDALREALR